MPAFGRVSPIIDPVLGIEIADVRTLNERANARIREIWHQSMLDLLQAEATFTPTATCTDPNCYAALQNAFLDEIAVRRSQGIPERTYEEFSAEFGTTYVPDYVALPHLDVHWFGIRRVGTTPWRGSICISNIEVVRSSPQRIALKGWPVVIPPPGLAGRVGFVAGRIAKFMMDTDLTTIQNQREVDFIHWVLPQSVEARHVVRGTNTYGRDVFRGMADGRRARVVGDVPTDVKRELEPEDNVADFPVFTDTGAVTAKEPTSPLVDPQPSSRG